MNLSGTEKGLLVVVIDGPEHLFGKTAYWKSDKQTFGRQDLFDLFGEFPGLERISREHLTIKKSGRNIFSRADIEIVDNNSTHGSNIELHPYASFVDGLYGSKNTWIIEFGKILKISIGTGFSVAYWPGGIKHQCEFCNMPIDFSKICEICIKTKPVNSVIVESFEKEKLVANLTLVQQQDNTPDGFNYIPGFTLSRNGQEFELTVSEIERIYNLLLNEFSYHHRMCSEYHDLT